MHNRYGRQGLMVIGASNEEPATVALRLQEQDDVYHSRGPGRVERPGKVQVRGIPTMVVIDKKGAVRMYEVGFHPVASKPRLEAMIKKLLAERA